MSILGNILWKAVFQNCKIIPDAIWRRGNLTGRRAFFVSLKEQAGKMRDITRLQMDEKGKHDEHI